MRRASSAAVVLLVLVALVLAACSPRAHELAPGGPFEPSETAREMLVLVNRARSSPRTCGAERLPAVPPLELEGRLTAAAQAHSQDMAESSFMGHVGSDGSSFIERAERHGYEWSALAENVAFGYGDAASVVDGWLGSPGHCVNIMNPRVRQLGVGLEGVYWTQLFGAPR